MQSSRPTTHNVPHPPHGLKVVSFTNTPIGKNIRDCSTTSAGSAADAIPIGGEGLQQQQQQHQQHIREGVPPLTLVDEIIASSDNGNSSPRNSMENTVPRRGEVVAAPASSNNYHRLPSSHSELVAFDLLIDDHHSNTQVPHSVNDGPIILSSSGRYQNGPFAAAFGSQNQPVPADPAWFEKAAALGVVVGSPMEQVPHISFEEPDSQKKLSTDATSSLRGGVHGNATIGSYSTTAVPIVGKASSSGAEPTFLSLMFSICSAEIELRVQLLREGLQQLNLLRMMAMCNFGMKVESECMLSGALTDLLDDYAGGVMENELVGIYELYSEVYPLVPTYTPGVPHQTIYSSIWVQQRSKLSSRESCRDEGSLSRDDPTAAAVSRREKNNNRKQSKEMPSISAIEVVNFLPTEQFKRNSLLRPSFYGRLPIEEQSGYADLHFDLRYFCLEHLAFVVRMEQYNNKQKTSIYHSLNAILQDSTSNIRKGTQATESFLTYNAALRGVLAVFGRDRDSLRDCPIPIHAFIPFPDGGWPLLLQVIEQGFSCSETFRFYHMNFESSAAGEKELMAAEANCRDTIEKAWCVASNLLVEVARDIIDDIPLAASMPRPYRLSVLDFDNSAHPAERTTSLLSDKMGLYISSPKRNKQFQMSTIQVVAADRSNCSDGAALIGTLFYYPSDTPYDQASLPNAMEEQPLADDAMMTPGAADSGIDAKLIQSSHSLHDPYEDSDAYLSGMEEAFMSGLDASLRYQSMYDDGGMSLRAPRMSGTWRQGMSGPPGAGGSSWGATRYYNAQRMLAVASHTSLAALAEGVKKGSDGNGYSRQISLFATSSMWLDLALSLSVEPKPISFDVTTTLTSGGNNMFSYYLSPSPNDKILLRLQNVERVVRAFHVSVFMKENMAYKAWTTTRLTQESHMLEMKTYSKTLFAMTMSWQSPKVRSVWSQLEEEKRLMLQNEGSTRGRIIFEHIAVRCLSDLYESYLQFLAALKLESDAFRASLVVRTSITDAPFVTRRVSSANASTVRERSKPMQLDEGRYTPGKGPLLDLIPSPSSQTCLMATIENDAPHPPRQPSSPPGGRPAMCRPMSYMVMGSPAAATHSPSPDFGQEEDMVTLRRMFNLPQKGSFVNSLGRVAWRTFLFCEGRSRMRLHNEWLSAWHEMMESCVNAAQQLQIYSLSGSTLRPSLQNAPTPPLVERPSTRPMPGCQRVSSVSSSEVALERTQGRSSAQSSEMTGSTVNLPHILRTASPMYHNSMNGSPRFRRSVPLSFWGHASRVPREEVDCNERAAVREGLVLMQIIVKELQSGAHAPRTRTPCYYGDHKFLNGDTYSGYWSENKRCGLGLYTFSAARITHLGDWSDDMPHGDGILLMIQKAMGTEKKRVVEVTSGTLLGDDVLSPSSPSAESRNNSAQATVPASPKQYNSSVNAMSGIERFIKSASDTQMYPPVHKAHTASSTTHTEMFHSSTSIVPSESGQDEAGSGAAGVSGSSDAARKDKPANTNNNNNNNDNNNKETNVDGEAAASPPTTRVKLIFGHWEMGELTKVVSCMERDAA